ncbi:MAG: rRNA maturation RNase YbeY [Lachnospiraceae bacterium]|nr:rRNA maturation RNase YbeY [Lachnospiraceae bacterium]
MTLNVEDESSVRLKKVDTEAVAKKVIEATLDYEGCPYEVEINLLLTDNETIRRINQEYRQIDKPTDVLSFPMMEYDIPSDFGVAETGVCDSFNPETGELVLGDIIISIEKVVEQAQKYGHSEEREFAFLITHSVLHLCGYDHMVPKEAKVMEDKQTAILNSLNILR